MKERYRGYVTGYHQAGPDHKVWSVRVKDPEAAEYDGRKLVVASVHGGLELARGLNIHFAIGTVDDASGHEVPRAVDVCLEVSSASGNTVNNVTNVNPTRSQHE